MFLTIDGNGNSDTYGDCMEYLDRTLSTHPLLTQSERDECAAAVGRLKRVLSRFYGTKAEK